MSPRQDISDKLIHFTSGENEEKAYQRQCTIVREAPFREKQKDKGQIQMYLFFRSTIG